MIHYKGVSIMDTFIFWLWFGICIVSIVLELATVTALVSIWFALGALVAMGAYFLNLSFTIQIFVFFLSSIAFVLIFRPLATKHLRGNTVPTNADRLIGMHTRLLKEIDENTLGEIKINGIIWNAISTDNTIIEKDALVKIIAIEGNKLLVRKID